MDNLPMRTLKQGSKHASTVLRLKTSKQVVSLILSFLLVFTMMPLVGAQAGEVKDTESEKSVLVQENVSTVGQTDNKDTSLDAKEEAETVAPSPGGGGVYYMTKAMNLPKKKTKLLP